MSTRHRPELDGIRGLAILGVLATHSCLYLQPTTLTKPFIIVMMFGQWGVDLFFALSGFLITGILLETRAATNYLSSFYVRRVLRIWPIYYLTLIVCFLLALVSTWVSAHVPVRAEWLSYALYLQNVPYFWANGYTVSPINMIGHFWSLAVEEQFYLVWPFVVMIKPEGALLALCAIGLAIALPLRLYLLANVFGASWAAMIITTARMDGLLVGAAYAILLYRFKRIASPLLVVPALGGVAILGWIAAFHFREEFLVGSGPRMRTFGVTAVALLSGALIALSQSHLGPLDRFLRSSALRFFGRYSYGIYIFHLPIFFAAARVYTAMHHLADANGLAMPLPAVSAVFFILEINAASVLVAVVSYQWIEAKILRLKSRFQPKFTVEPGEQKLAPMTGG